MTFPYRFIPATRAIAWFWNDRNDCLQLSDSEPAEAEAEYVIPLCRLDYAQRLEREIAVLEEKLSQSDTLMRVRAEAIRQLSDELFAIKVAEEKRRILERRPFWHKLFPWRITITRR